MEGKFEFRETVEIRIESKNVVNRVVYMIRLNCISSPFYVMLIV